MSVETTNDVDPLRVNRDGIDPALTAWRAVNWGIEGDTKIPKRPANPARNARSNDASTWGTFEQALENADRDDLGIGFPCAQPGHPFTFVDVDIPDGDEWVPSFDRLGGCMIERSPSGRSRRIILRDCEVPAWWTNQSEPGKDTREIKLFTDSGYVTLTGDVVDGFGTPLEATHSPALEAWLKDAWRAFNPDADSEPWEDSRADEGGSSTANMGAQDRDEWMDADAAREALAHIDPDLDNDEWVTVGFALADRFTQATAERLFTEWSRSGVKWNAEARNRAPKILDDANGTVEISHLVNKAKAGGWDASSAAREATARNTENDHDLTDADRWRGIRDLYSSGDRGTTGTANYHAATKLAADMDVVTTEDTGVLWRYDPTTGVYTDDARARIRAALADELADEYKPNRVNDVIHACQSQTFIQRDELGGPDDLLCVGNGVVDLSDPTAPTLTDHSPEHGFISRLPVGYNPDADCPEWREFIGEVVRSEDLAKLQEYAGYCLHIWGYPHKRMVCITGPTDAGKSVFLRVIRAVIGDNNVATESPQSLADTRWGAANLFGKVANIDNELSTEVSNTGLLKKVSGGGDPITAENKGQDPFTFVPHAKHLFATNQIPSTPNADEAFYNRWLFVTFPRRIPDAEQDRDLAPKIVENELPGVLNWMLEGYARLMQQDRFSDERSTGEKEGMWQAHGDSIARFLETECNITHDNDDATATEDAYVAYESMCETMGSPAQTRQTLARRLRQRGLSTSQRKVNATHTHASRPQCWVGVVLKATI